MSDLADVDAAFERGALSQVQAESLVEKMVQRGRALHQQDADDEPRLSVLLAETPTPRIRGPPVE